MDDRDVVEGVLGCPVCLAEFPVHEGVVRLSGDQALRGAPPVRAAHEEDAVRLAAALDLTEARMTAVLQGSWGALAPMMRGLTPAQFLLVNPPAGITSGDGISIIEAARAPLAAASVDAVAFDANADDAMVTSLVAAVQGGGRVVGPVARAIPDALAEMARDDALWVSSKAPALVLPLRRARR
jgi:hypothetical protein